MAQRIFIECVGRSADDTRDLATRLQQQLPESEAAVRVIDVEPEPGEMGSGAEIVELLLGPGGIGVQVATATVAWLTARRTNARLHIKTGNVDLEVTGSLAKKDRDAAIQAILTAIQSVDPSSRPPQSNPLDEEEDPKEPRPGG